MLVLMGVLAGPVAAQGPAARQVTYTTEQGLPTNLIKSVLPSRSGLVWMATDAGLVRADGHRFVRYDLPDLPAGYVKRVIERRSGKLVVVADEGVYEVTARHDALAVRPLSTGVPTLRYPKEAFEDHDGTLWIGSSDAVARLHPDGRVRSFRFPRDHGSESFKHGFKVARLGPDLVVASERGHFYRYDAARDRLVPLPGLPARPFPNVTLLRLDGERLLVGDGDGVHALTRAADGRYTRALAVPLGGVEAFAVGPDGVRWLGTSNQGLFVVRPGQERPAPVPDVPIVPVSDLHTDREGHVWMAADNGVTVFVRPAFATVPSGPGHVLEGLARSPDGSLYVLDGGRVARITQADGGFRLTPVTPPRDGLVSLEATAQGLWVGTATGQVERVGGPTVTLAPAVVQSIEAGPAGSVWVGQDHVPGLTRVTHEGRVFRYGADRGLPGFQPEVVRHVGGVLYAAGRGTGGVLFRYDARADRFLRVPVRVPGPDFVIHDLADDEDGRLWLGTSRGLVRLEASGMLMFPDESDDELRSSVRALVRGPWGTFWVGTDRFVFRYAPGSLARFGRDDGLTNLTVALRSLLVGDDGRLWVRHHSGLAYGLDPGPMRETPVPQFLGTGVQPGAALPAGRTLEVEVTALSYPGERVRYQWRLAGHTDWSPATTRADLLVPAPSPGSHRLEVRAQQVGHRWSRPAALAFTVAPPWYRTPGAYAGYVMLLLLLATLGGDAPPPGGNEPCMPSFSSAPATSSNTPCATLPTPATAPRPPTWPKASFWPT
jgi:ligand-binding sensor domain-containing protein